MLRQEIGVALGASFVRIFVKGRGIVLREPSLVAFRSATGEVMAVGREVADRLGAPTTMTDMSVAQPLRDGMFAEADLTAKMLQTFISRVGRGSGRFLKPDIVLSPSPGASEVEKHAVQRVVQASAHRAFLLARPLAAALGAGVELASTGAMIVSLGGGTTNIAMLSREGVVVSESLRVAGDAFDEAIVRRVRRQENLLIGERAAERLKLELGAALPSLEEKSEAVRGRDLTTGIAKTAQVTAQDVAEALRDPLLKIAKGVRRVLEAAPAERAADVVNQGVILTGGSAQLPHLATFLGEQTGLGVTVADQPADCVALGLGRVSEQPELRPMLVALD